MVGFDVVFDIIVKILVSLLLLVATTAAVGLAIFGIATGQAVWPCIAITILALGMLGICIALCASAQGEL